VTLGAFGISLGRRCELGAAKPGAKAHRRAHLRRETLKNLPAVYEGARRNHCKLAPRRAACSVDELENF